MSAEVLVVHCIDTEGPIGGNVRRRPDGSAEFMDNWPDIEQSIRRLTSPEFRATHADSHHLPYRYNWFIMDFTGFTTNPKNRVARYHDTYDHFKALPTAPDGFYWHYHHPPASGVGDEWSSDWDSSQEYLNILTHRLVERGDFPEAYRAGGTIEDNKASLWLEENILIDYSNRVHAAVVPTTNIFDFNWYGASGKWGFYHPHPNNFLQPGSMRRYIVRSVDLRSRLHELQEAEVEECFARAQELQQPVILSYFSHDHRDMNEETHYAHTLLNKVAVATKVPWRSSLALEAVQISDAVVPSKVTVDWQMEAHALTITCSQPIYQKVPWVGVQTDNGEITRLHAQPLTTQCFVVKVPGNAKKVVIGGTSLTGDKFIKSIDL